MKFATGKLPYFASESVDTLVNDVALTLQLLRVADDAVELYLRDDGRERRFDVPHESGHAHFLQLW